MFTQIQTRAVHLNLPDPEHNCHDLFKPMLTSTLRPQNLIACNSGVRELLQYYPKCNPCVNSTIVDNRIEHDTITTIKLIGKFIQVLDNLTVCSFYT